MTPTEQDEAIILLRHAMVALRARFGQESAVALLIDEFLAKVDDDDPFA